MIDIQIIIICSVLIIAIWATVHELLALDKKVKILTSRLDSLTKIVTEQPDDDIEYEVEMSVGKNIKTYNPYAQHLKSSKCYAEQWKELNDWVDNRNKENEDSKPYRTVYDIENETKDKV